MIDDAVQRTVTSALGALSPATAQRSLHLTRGTAATSGVNHQLNRSRRDQSLARGSSRGFVFVSNRLPQIPRPSATVEDRLVVGM